MRTFKQFLLGQREIELTEPFIIVHENISPKLYEFLQYLYAIQFEDGAFQKYFGQIKLLVNRFINYWTDVINMCFQVKEAMRVDTTKEQLYNMVDKTILTQCTKQETFSNSFLPAQSDEELEKFNCLQEMLQLRLKDLREMKTLIRDLEVYEIHKFVIKHVNLGIKKKYEAFSFTHTMIAKQLAKHALRIRISLEEILLRMRNNLKQIKEEQRKSIYKYLKDLYDQNKEVLHFSRTESDTNVAEVRSLPALLTLLYTLKALIRFNQMEISMNKTREKIKILEAGLPVEGRLEMEIAHWEKRLKDFVEIETTINKLKAELDKVIECEKRYKSLKSSEHPDSKNTCFEYIGENLKKRRKYIEEIIVEVAKTLMTFFSVRGQNRTFYQNHFGRFVEDDYGHQIYFFNDGKLACHVSCDGSYSPIYDKDKYYYDSNGRYTLDAKGEKVYQCAPCTSTYKLGEDDLLVKTTKDCGHSEVPNPACKMQPITDVKMITKVDPVDIKKTLQPEKTKYLWDCFGHVLPKILFEAQSNEPNIPMHYLAHKMLYHKYFKGFEDKKKAKTYRESILEEVKRSMAASSRAWLEKHLKRRKPEDSDETDTLAFMYRDQLFKLSDSHYE